MNLDLQQAVSICGRAVLICSRAVRFVAGRKIIKVALSAALEPTTAAREFEPRSMLCLRRTFPKKNLKEPDTF